LGARHAMSTTTSHAKAEQARTLGFDEVIDLSTEKLGEGVRRITGGYGSDVVIDAMGGDILSEALGTLAMSGSLTTLGYSAGRNLTASQAYTTLELKAAYHKPVTEDTGLLGAKGQLLSFSKRVAFAEVKLTDARGKLYASATSTLLVFKR